MIGAERTTGFCFGLIFVQFNYQRLFLFVERASICNFADKNKVYRCDSDLEIALKDLQRDV